MSRRRWTVLAAMVLFWGAVADASIWPKWLHLPKRKPPEQTKASDPKKKNPQPDPNNTGQRPDPANTSTSATGGGKQGAHIKGPSHTVISRGQTQQLTWSVTDSTKPVRLRVQNSSPEIGKLGGGDTQIVTTSGGGMNAIQLTVTGLSPGELQINVEDIDASAPDPERAREIASVFKARLQWVADRLEVAARELPVRTPRSSLPITVGSEDVLQLLARVEADVREVLPYQELAPFRDAVAALLDEARNEVRRMTEADTMGALSSGSAIVLVRSNLSSQPGRLEEQTFRSIVARVVAFLRNTSEMSPGDTVCFLTTPENGANILLYPESFPSDRWNVPTASRKWLYLGRYVFEITRPAYLNGRGHVDLLLDSQRVIECGLSRTAAIAQACRPVAGTIGRCP